MVWIDISGRFPQRVRFDRYCDDVMNELLHVHPKKNWIVDVKMKHNLVHEGWPVFRGDYIQDAGYCVSPDYGYIIVRLARNWIDDDREAIPYDINELVTTCAHELVHAKQYITGEIGGDDRMIDGYPASWWMAHFSHHELPWEREAHELENLLVDHW